MINSISDFFSFFWLDIFENKEENSILIINLLLLPIVLLFGFGAFNENISNKCGANLAVILYNEMNKF